MPKNEIQKSKIKNQNLRSNGFSLVELLVVIAIIAVLSVSSLVGFGHLGDTLRVREVTGFLGDSIKQEELKILRGDFEKATIHFLENYVVIEEQGEDANTKLLTLGTECSGDYNIKFSDDGSLTQRDGEDRTMEIKNVVKDASECIAFKEAKDIEWNYQLSASDKHSSILRFVHFNLQRDSLNNPAFINSNVGYTIEIMAPYGKKLVYDDTGKLLDGSVKIEVTNNSGSTDELILQQ